MENSETKGVLYMIPSLLGETEPLEVLPLSVKKVIGMCQHFVVENEKTARAFIKTVASSKSQSSLNIQVLNKFTEPGEVPTFLDPCLNGHHVGMISEAGAPGIADPGADIVTIAHNKGIKVVPLVGPSSISLALMASGLNGQNFAFSGYLPIDKNDRKNRIKELERLSHQMEQSQIFMETPYRNNKLFADLMRHLRDSTQLTVAREITTPKEFIKTAEVGWWKNNTPDLEKKPAIFILQA